MVKHIHGLFEDSEFLRLKSAKDAASKEAGHTIRWEKFIMQSVFGK